MSFAQGLTKEQVGQKGALCHQKRAAEANQKSKRWLAYRV